MSQQKTITRVTKRTVLPEGADLFSERAFVVSIQDEGGGEFVELLVPGNADAVQIDPEEWPAIRDAINASMASIEEYERRKESGRND